MDVDALLAEQIDYYRARAPEYDRWWHRTDQYELAPDAERRWHEEIAELEAMVLAWVGRPSRVLEIASGTGIWTVKLAAAAASVVAVDAAAETVEVAKAKLETSGLLERVRFVEADVFAYEPEAGAFDVVFFSFWLSHVPPERLDRFWTTVENALAPGGRAVLIDNRWNDGVWPPPADRPTDPVQVRSDISSGAEYRIVKMYYEPDELAAMLEARGWRSASMTATGRFFVAGWGER